MYAHIHTHTLVIITRDTIQDLSHCFVVKESRKYVAKARKISLPRCDWSAFFEVSRIAIYRALCGRFSIYRSVNGTRCSGSQSNPIRSVVSVALVRGPKTWTLRENDRERVICEALNAYIIKCEISLLSASRFRQSLLLDRIGVAIFYTFSAITKQSYN